MYAAISSSWALLLGIGLIMLGNGLQGSLLGLRASLEGFPTAITGLVMTGYFVGFLAGSNLTSRMLRHVGHIRVFAALASLASTSALAHAVFVDPFTWVALRLVTGFCFAGLYIVAESWLNDRADNRTRGQLLSVYMVIVFLGMASGQFLLNVADPQGFVLFIVISVLVSVALVPISLSPGAAPAFAEPAHIGLRELYAMSPLGVVGCLGTGAAHGAFFGMGAVYAEKFGLRLVDISVFMASGIIGGVVFQWPIGRLSDRFDRRWVMTIATFLAAGGALIASGLPGTAGNALFALIFVFGGLSLPMYSLSIAQTNDHLEPAQMVAASSSLVMVSGVGASLGPMGAATLMSGLGPSGFFLFLTLAHGLIGVFALYRMTQRAPAPLDEQVPYVALPPRVSPVSAVIAENVRDEIDRD